MRRREVGDRGAAAVEFALVVPVLLLLVFGIIDYGLYFTNRLAVQQGTHDAARQAVIGPPFGSETSCGGAWSAGMTEDMKQLGCSVHDRTGPVVGTAYVKILLPDGWHKSRRLVVCEVVETDGLTGFVPMPNGGLVSSKAQMTIEQDVTTPPEPQGGSQTLPAGMSWAPWCS